MSNEFLRCIDGLESLSIIKEGLYKDTYRCLYKGRRSILSHYRIDNNPFNLDPKREFNLLNSIEGMNLTPEPLFYSDESKILIVTEIEGEHISQLKNRQSLLSDLAKRLNSLHSYPVDDFDRTFRDTLMAYGRQMEKEDEKNIFTAAIDLHDALSEETGKNCLCHNDLHPENVLVGEQIKFIDWDPASTTHQRMSVEALEEAGISEGLIRLSIGIESVDDLIEDLENGFRAAAKALKKS